MTTEPLSPAERQALLKTARQALVHYLTYGAQPDLDLAAYPPRLRAPGASFVTLTINGQLRGCIGTLEAYQPLLQDVCEHAIAAASEDYRFAPVRKEELAHIAIEISCLTDPVPLQYDLPLDLPTRLTPGVDGVVIKDSGRRATFLPQVWEKLPDPVEFLNHLCRKMGAPTNLWQRKLLEVYTYQVEEFHEKAEPDE